MKLILKGIWFVFLTVVTQIGGIAFILHLLVFDKIWKPKKWQWIKRQASFFGIYLLLSFVVVPPLAKLNHRQPLPYMNITTLQPQNWFTVVCNRHYVHEDLYPIIVGVADDFNNQSTEKDGLLQLNYLDANFPFIDGFPLIPHLSHNDGKKLDLAFRYRSNTGGPPTNKTRSLSGYGVYVVPEEGEIDQTAICKENHWRYDATKYVAIPINRELIYDHNETERLMALLVNTNIDKIFIEPHLKLRMTINSDKVRFHGCHAVRHDDHIHVQIQ